MKLSILIPSLADRAVEFAAPLIASINDQIGAIPPVAGAGPEVELIVLTDSRYMSIGAKRNMLLWMAHGDYVAFVDDDDTVAADYVEALLWTINRFKPDVVTFNIQYTDNGQNPTLCKYSKNYECYTREEGIYHFRPSPQHAWRREIALAVGYPDVNWKEDDHFRLNAAKYIRTEANIDRVLYHYRYRGNK